MATIDNNTPQGEPVCDQQPISVQPGLAVILDTREIAKITEIVRKAKQSIEFGHSSFRDGAGHFRDAAEYLAVAQELGVSQRKLADEVNKSPAWVNSLLGWRERGYPDRTPFTQRPPAKAVQQTEQSSRPALASPQCTRDAASTELTKTDKSVSVPISTFRTRRKLPPRIIMSISPRLTVTGRTIPFPPSSAGI